MQPGTYGFTIKGLGARHRHRGLSVSRFEGDMQECFGFCPIFSNEGFEDLCRVVAVTVILQLSLWHHIGYVTECVNQ
jgi:hypothetical protein